MNKKTLDKYRTFLVVLLIFICVFLYAIAVSIHSNTMIDGWLPAVGASVLAAISGTTLARIWQKITGSSKFAVNYICNLIFATGLLLALFYGCNFAFSRGATSEPHEAIVEKKYSKVRHHSRRVGRNRYVRGEAYNVYYIDVRFDNGRMKDLSMPFERYRRIHVGDTLSIPFEKGLFGIPVIKRRGTPVDAPQSDYSRQFRRS